MPLNRVLLVLLGLLAGMAARATTFTVTTNADSGPGSLRDAITQAAANGSAATDNIVFNIADQSVGGRTITLQSELPALSSNLVIDGTTQPGAAFGISAAKIEICLPTAPQQGYFTCLLILNATNVQLYGLYLLYAQDPQEIEDVYGVRMEGSTNITIGAAGKGNVIDGWFWNITNSYWNGYYNDTSNTISIKGNLLGLSVNGTPAVGAPIDILLNYTHDVDIGGLNPGEGNQMTCIFQCISASHNDNGNPAAFFIHLRNNLLNVDPTGTIPYGGGIDGIVDLNGVNIATTDTETVKTELTNNVISGSEVTDQVMLTGIHHLVKVMGNKIGADITGTKQIGSANIGLYISGCFKVLVGGDNAGDTNYFAGNEIGLMYSAPHCLISKNAFFCNNTGIELDGWSGPGAEPFITMNTYTPAVIGGTANPLARIELFQNNTCNAGYCEGRYYVATVYADNQGNWSYTGPQTPSMIATATTVDSATSAFPEPALSASGAVVSNATCGKNNGSITGVQILNGTTFKWVSITDGSTVGTDTNLVNVGPGSYSLVVSFGTNGCSVQTQFYNILNIQPPPTIQTDLLNPTCGQRNGEIFVYGDLTGLVGKWVDALGDTLSFNEYDPYFPPGTFRYVLYPPGDVSCMQVYGPYTLVSQNGASVDESGAQITAATCNQSNGGISGLQFTNVTGTPAYVWVDAAGQAVGAALNLSNVPPGQYTLKFKDQGTCDTIVSGPFTVGDAGLVRWDSSGRVIQPSQCAAPTGSIGNITAADAVSYQWVDTVTGAVAGSSPNLVNAAPGYYRLTVVNSTGCSASAGPYQIPQTPVEPLQATLSVRQESCNQENGSLAIATLTPDPPGYTYEWVMTNSNQAVGTGSSVTQLAAGAYSLYATDNNGCRQLVDTVTLADLPGPQIGGGSIGPDVCSGNNGFVKGLTVTGSGPFSYTWYATGGGQEGQGQDLTGQPSGSYYVIVTDANNCSTTSPAFVIGDSSLEIAQPQYQDQIVLTGGMVTLKPGNTDSGTYLLFLTLGTGDTAQQNSSGIFSIGPMVADTTVYVVLADGSCSSAPAPVQIKVVQTLTIVMPNAFSPNGDGHNDLFRVKYPDVIKTFQLRIYNRWGQAVFVTSDPYAGWDGRTGNQPQPAGVYVWEIRYTNDITNKVYNMNGTVILVR